MTSPIIPDDIRRFVLSGIISVPHIEALLLFHRNQNSEMSIRDVATELYINEDTAVELIKLLQESGFIAVTSSRTAPVYQYRPDTAANARLVDGLAKVYSKELIEITNLIHSKSALKQQGFADAFKIRKE